MDKIDKLIVRILTESSVPINLERLKKEFWNKLKEEDVLKLDKNGIGARITQLYLTGMIDKREGGKGYFPTCRGTSLVQD